MARQAHSPRFPSSWLRELDALEARWQGGDNVQPATIQLALARWRERLHRPAVADEEWLDLVDARGEPLGMVAPRWFVHLTGLRHRVAHVLLMTPQGLLGLQMRAHDKPEWPDRLDTTVGGHLKAGQSWQSGVLTEIHEEIGLAPADLPRWLAEARLTPVGAPFESYGWDDGRPPIRNRQVNQIFTGALTAWGMTHLRFADGELDGMYFTLPDTAKRMVDANDERIAPGLRNVFPRWWRFIRASAPQK